MLVKSFCETVSFHYNHIGHTSGVLIKRFSDIRITTTGMFGFNTFATIKFKNRMRQLITL